MTDQVNVPRIRLLIVDDNPRWRERIFDWTDFEPDMCAVGQAANGQDAVEQVLHLKPHVVLMDVAMPIMDGWTAAKIIKIRFPQVQVIIISGILTVTHVRQGFIDGVSDVVDKSDLDFHALADLIRTVHGGKEKS